MVAMQAALRERPSNVASGATIAVGRSKQAQSLFALTKEELAKEITHEEEMSTDKIRKALLAAGRAKRAQEAAAAQVQAEPPAAELAAAALPAAAAEAPPQPAEEVVKPSPGAASSGAPTKAMKPRMHSKSEASLLVHDAALHEWLRKRQRKTEPAKPRTYMTRHRRQSLQKAFESIDRDGSGSIDRGELVRPSQA
jgi:hypothetical protein